MTPVERKDMTLKCGVCSESLWEQSKKGWSPTPHLHSIPSHDRFATGHTKFMVLSPMLP